jgi:hypothetical protein
MLLPVLLVPLCCGVSAAAELAKGVSAELAIVLAMLAELTAASDAWLLTTFFTTFLTILLVLA